jgi:DNA repair exonuclease SbcCD ATPase subunit
MCANIEDELNGYAAGPKEPVPELDNPDMDDVLSSLQDKLKDLQNAVSEIKDMIDERKRLGHDVCNEIQEELCRASSFLQQFEMPGAIRVGMEKIRGVFEKEMFALRSERRKEVINEWEDITRLKMELREHTERMEDLRRKLKEARK